MTLLADLIEKALLVHEGPLITDVLKELANYVEELEARIEALELDAKKPRF